MLSRALKRRLSALRRHLTAPDPKAPGVVVPSTHPPSDPPVVVPSTNPRSDPPVVVPSTHPRSDPPRDASPSPAPPGWLGERVDRVYHMPPQAAPVVGRAAPPAPRRPAPEHRESAGTWSVPEVLLAPPPLRTIQTSRGAVLVRRMSVAIDAPLCDALARDTRRESSGEQWGASLLFDTETTGLGSSTLFLAGLAWFDGTCLAIEQVFAENQSREAALLCRVAERFARARRIVTFNGRSYDLPLLRDRTVRHRLPRLPDVPDVDLLTLARRRWRKRLPDCRLTTIEAHVLRRHRRADVDGRAIPALYHRSVRTGDARLIAPVLYHNALDLLTTAELMARLDPGRGEDGCADAGGGEATRRWGRSEKGGGAGDSAPGGEDAPGPARQRRRLDRS